MQETQQEDHAQRAGDKQEAERQVGVGVGMGATRLQLKRLPKDFLGVGWDEGFRVFRA